MTVPRWRPALLLALTLPAGCLFADHRSLEERKWDPPPEPMAFTFPGVIRDFTTMRPEPGAELEFWSDDPGYLPAATITPDGGYSVLVDLCRRRTTLAGDVAQVLVDPEPRGCWRTMGQFGLRARLGDRCSFAIEYGGPGWGRREPTLWLHPCRTPERALHPWQTLPRDPGSSAAAPGGAGLTPP